MEIIIDYREKKLIKLMKSQLELYEYKNIEIKTENLPLGDIIVKKNNEELLIIERKTLNDLASSIRDGRYKEQSFRLNNTNLHNHNIIYLIEGDITMWSNSFTNIKPETLYVSLFSLLYFSGFSVMRTLTLAETGEFILRITDKLIRSKNKKNYYDVSNTEVKEYVDVIKREKKNNITIENIDEIMLSQIPNVSISVAKALIKHYNDIYTLKVELEKNEKCLDKVRYVNKNKEEKSLNKLIKNNITKYILKRKDTIIKIKT